jgi:hypothetical protein
LWGFFFGVWDLWCFNVLKGTCFFLLFPLFWPSKELEKLQNVSSACRGNW